jgi:hypothetical protein
MSYISESGLAQVLDQGFNLPQSRLEPEACIPVGYLQLAPGQLARVRWLSVHLVRILADSAPVKVNGGLGSVYAGLYALGGAIRLSPGQPLAYTPVDVPGVNQTSPAFYHDLESPGTYLILLVNNLGNARVDVSVTGSFRVSNLPVS